jgi:(p)ppGpp synthase/HD superfamily hydrolase
MSTLADAIRLAVEKHAGQVEKPGGTPYVLHPLRVMQRVADPEAKVVAVLHDVVEDTGTSPDDLRRLGFAERVVQGVLSVTRRADESYADFVARAKADPLGRAVKLADIEDNYNLPRALLRADRLDRDLARLRKYALSYKFLTDELTEAQYRAAMEGAE